MPRHSITVTAYHADGTICPSGHRHTTGGTPLTEGCTGRERFVATCSCNVWTSSPSSTKSYAAELGRRHRSDQRPANSTPPPKGPAVLRELLQFDAED
ncbi:hypothetical protein SLV14_003590 [Streptomyces sp. Je 1-4]|uniref:hypothetical protein n=1 Tax=Streptomyces TaxID=1883 RepID=UPI0021DA2CB5|nr:MULTISPECIES: hypothetical protein [unclassified Streptomyces]UYB40912.1 hypothetical protein SLV14_003590 [Streptomyces sp. Je 1-4]UZQ37072.1 hypothetical protein SLV14N_003590 [Streptomyces sp. Je 1-4] [Streptomyces sp. Je 1-4 4N24]UZQ44489.1 hypothetical protein SLV14NA_003590 [Streptomyces sp. Je 1-4] [Streptomyces sp. Je 1-4 4N24_ara]